MAARTGAYPTMCPKDDPNSIGKNLTKITDDQNRRVDYYLSETGQLEEALTNQTYAGSSLSQYLYTRYNYDQYHGWLTSIQNQWKKFMYGFWQTTTLSQNAYTYDESGMRLTNQITLGGNTRTETYGYDELYRLTSVNYGDGQTQSYTFDPMGNRTQKADSVSGTENYSYNNANMLLTRGANNYSNDLAGNTLTGGGRTNTWDSQNRLAQCVFNGTTSTFTYAADGIRHRSVVGANTTDYVLDSSMFVREKLNGAVSATYLVGARGPEYRRNDSTGVVRWYVFDGLGSVLGEVDTNGTVTASRTYDAYGLVRSSAGTSTSKHKFVGNLGHPSEDETGLVYMRARYMDPVTGRFASEDPSLEGKNWFLYAADAPTVYVDRTGNSTEDAVWAFIGNLFVWIGRGLALYGLYQGGTGTKEFYQTLVANLSKAEQVIGPFERERFLKEVVNVFESTKGLKGKLTGALYSFVTAYVLDLVGTIILAGVDQSSPGQYDWWGMQ